MNAVRELLPPGGARRDRVASQISAALAGLDYPATKVGVVGNITVYYDPALGAQGQALATQMLGAVAGPYNDMQIFFGIAGGAVSVVIAPLSGNNNGSGGAYHYGCDFTSGGVLYLDPTFASTTVNPLNLEVALYVAELSEAFMGAQNRGWGCGFSNGEALSRFLAEQETPDGTLNAFVTGPAWDQAHRPNWINTTEQTDRDSLSTGCGIVYLYWLRTLGFTIPQIVQAGGATLAANYQTLTGKTTAFQDLLAGLTGYAVTSDNPFDGRAAAVGVNSDGRLEVFGVGTDRAIWHIWQEAPHAGPWSAWSSLGGGTASDAAVADNSDGRLEVFVRGNDRALWHIWQETAHSGPWSAWSSLGGIITSNPAVAVNTDGRLEAFARGTDNALWHIWQTAPHSGPWSAWSSLGGVITSDPTVGVNSDGRMEVFARGTDNALWHIWQTAPHSGPWSAWSSLGGVLTDDAAVAVNSDGRLEVFVRGTDDALWHIWQTAPHAGPWSAWSSLGGSITSDPVVFDNSDGRLEVFVRGTDHALWHIWQEAPHAGPWSAWASLGGVITSDPAVALNTDGRLELFARGTDNALWHIWQTAPHSGPWSAWASLGGILLDEPTVG
jgi:chitodextrinase